MRASQLRPKSKVIFTPNLPIMLIISFLSGLGFVYSLAPYYAWGVAIVSVLVLYWLLLFKLSNLRAFLVGWAYGFGLWLSGAFWLYTSIHDYGAIAPWLAFLMIAIMAVVMGLFHAVSAWIFVRFFGKQPLGFAALWVIQEWVKTWLFSGFPWLFVGYAYTDLFVATSMAPIIGIFGLSFLSVLLSASLVEAFRQKLGYLLIFFVTMGACLLVYFINPSWTLATGKQLSVSLVQGNIAQMMKWDEAHQMDILATYANLSKSEWGQDLVVWPEGAIPAFQDELGDYIQTHAELAKSSGSAWVTGLPYKGFEDMSISHVFPPLYNAVLVNGEGSGVYKKQHLVPFGEYTPFGGVLDLLPNLATNHAIMNHSRGKPNQPLLNIKDSKTGVAICYEVAYPDTTRQNAKNSDFMITVSNDAWFGKSIGPYQHLQIVQMRAIETGRWFVRGTNNGVSAIINHKGELVKTANQFEKLVLRGYVQARQGETPVMRWGYVPILTLACVLIFLSVLAKLHHRYALMGKRFSLMLIGKRFLSKKRTKK